MGFLTAKGAPRKSKSPRRFNFAPPVRQASHSRQAPQSAAIAQGCSPQTQHFLKKTHRAASVYAENWALTLLELGGPKD